MPFVNQQDSVVHLFFFVHHEQILCSLPKKDKKFQKIFRARNLPLIKVEVSDEKY